MPKSSGIQNSQNIEIIPLGTPPGPPEVHKEIWGYFGLHKPQNTQLKTPYYRKSDHNGRMNAPREGTRNKPTIRVDERDIEKANRRTWLSQPKSIPDISRTPTPKPASSEPGAQRNQCKSFQSHDTQEVAGISAKTSPMGTTDAKLNRPDLPEAAPNELAGHCSGGAPSEPPHQTLQTLTMSNSDKAALDEVFQLCEEYNRQVDAQAQNENTHLATSKGLFPGTLNLPSSDRHQVSSTISNLAMDELDKSMSFLRSIIE